MASGNSSAMNMSHGNSTSMNMSHGNSTSMSMGHGMAHMSMSAGVSLSFGIVVLVVCSAVILHILFTLVRKGRPLGNLSGHSTFRHSIPMTLGMISTMTIGTAIGGMMETQLSAAYIIGFGVGVILGFLIGLSFKEMAILDGMIAGIMGGLMGIMLGDMVPQTGLYAITSLLTAMFILTWGVMLGRIEGSLSPGERTVVSRRFVQTVLGLIWLIDGVFQLKPQMFTDAFLNQVILPTSQSQPTWITALVKWGAHIAAFNITAWDTVFAVVQIVIGLGFILNFKIRWTIIASLIWTLIVWSFGEGFGQLLTGQTLLLNGAPGAVLLYGIIGIAIWPSKERSSKESLPLGMTFARYSLGLVWILGSGLHFQTIYLTSNGFSQSITATWFANLVGGSGLVISIVLAILEFAIGLLLLLNIRVRVVVWSSMILSFIFWWVGQDFGQIFTPLATDFNSGLLMIVLSLCISPSLPYGFVIRHSKLTNQVVSQ